MKNVFVIIISFMFCTKGLSQQETLDYMTYTPPAGWNKEMKQGCVVFSKIDNSTKTWCQIAVYKATATKGTVDADFKSEWNSLIKEPLKISDEAQTSEVQDMDGWKIKSGSANFVFNNANATTSLTTISGYNICFSIVANTNSQDFSQAINDFIGSVALNKPDVTQQNTQSGTVENTVQSTQGINNGYTFNTTNFDDGWTSTVQEDWVEVTKGNIKVLLHYAKEGTIFPADPEPLTNAAWNILVAPRYSSMQNYKVISPTSDDYAIRPYIAMATMVEKGTGKNEFVLLFRRSAGWVEVVAPGAKVFADEFGFDPTSIRFGKNSRNWGGYILETNTGVTVDADGKVFGKIDGMITRNKFAVSANDLYSSGEWDQNFSSNTFYYNYYTGASAGISTYSSSQWFVFGDGQSYKWQIVATNSYGGSTSFAQGKGAGNFKSLGNWQLYFSDMEGKPKTFDVYFTAVKGGRILFMNDAKYPGSGVFTGYSKK